MAYHLPADLFFSKPVSAKIIEAATRAAPIPSGTIKIQWPGDETPIIEPRKDALLRCLGNADTAIQLARINRKQPTEISIRKRLSKLYKALKKAADELKSIATDQDADAITLKLIDQLDLMATRSNGFPMYPPKEWAIPKSLWKDNEKPERFIDYHSSDLLRDFIDNSQRMAAITKAATSAVTEPQKKSGKGNKSNAWPKDQITLAMTQNDPINAALRMIHFAWVHVLRRRPTFTINPITNEASGDYLEFAASITSLMGFKLSGKAIKERLGRMDNITKVMPARR